MHEKNAKSSKVRKQTNVERKDDLYEEKLAVICLLYTSDAADEEDSVELGVSSNIKKKQKKQYKRTDAATERASVESGGSKTL